MDWNSLIRHFSGNGGIDLCLNGYRWRYQLVFDHSLDGGMAKKTILTGMETVAMTADTRIFLTLHGASNI